MKKPMKGYSNSHSMPSGGGKDGPTKNGGGDLAMGLSSRTKQSNYAKGDNYEDSLPNGGADPDYSVKKAGKTFTIC